jgi:hypothetical protein
METTITCPSGLTGKIRGMRVREERILADRQLAKSGAQTDALLAACWQDTLDPDLYALNDGALDWLKVLSGDRFYALLQLRIATYGPSYAFSVPCSSCRAKIDWEIDLSELPVKKLPEPSRASFAAGNRFETTLPDGSRKLWFKLMLGDDERKLPQLRRSAPDRVLSALLAHRVLEVEGIEAREKRRFLEDLSMADATQLFHEFDEADCGVETKINIECPECGAEQEIELPFGREFFLPTTKGQRSERSRS